MYHKCFLMTASARRLRSTIGLGFTRESSFDRLDGSDLRQPNRPCVLEACRRTRYAATGYACRPSPATPTARSSEKLQSHLPPDGCEQKVLYDQLLRRLNSSWGEHAA